jgi:hypothetical protein
MNPNWVEEEIIPWANSKAEFNTTALEPALAVAPNARRREVMPCIGRPILLITGDLELHAIVSPEIAQEAAQIWRNGEVVRLILRDRQSQQ